MKRYLKTLYLLFCGVFFNPIQLLNKWRAIPYFLINGWRYRHGNQDAKFPLSISNLHYCTNDRFDTAGVAQGHYFHQDLWAARVLFERKAMFLVDIGSRVDGFIGHVLTFCQVCYVDIRALKSKVHGLEFRQGSIECLPFQTDSIPYLSCLHVIEHIGLGRYGDPVNSNGYLLAAHELARVLQKDGVLLLSTPVGRERLCFDAHRVFDPQTITDALTPLKLLEFSLIDDTGVGIMRNASFDQARACEYGCGLFVFTKIGKE